MKLKIEDITKVESFRTINVSAADIYEENVVNKKTFVVENNEDCFNDLFSNLMPLNLDLIYLFQIGKLKYKYLEGEFYTYDFIDVSFSHIKKSTEKDIDIREYLYLNGFNLNNHHYVRYKRSAGSAKKGNCLFVKEELYKPLHKWSCTGLDETKDLCFKNLTSYEAYRALSLSSLIKVFRFNPYNVLFVKDVEVFLDDQKVIKVFEKGNTLDAIKDTCTIKNNIFDGEGLLDCSVFKELGFAKKGMMLLRNRFFKCCAFNTNLQHWFTKNKITKISQLNGITFAKNVSDIKLVVSESCLKYFKMVEDGYSEATIKRWCDNIVDEDGKSLFGIVKTDKKTRFFDGDMVETTYQLLNSLHLKFTNINTLIQPYIQYISYIRDLKKTPEFIRYYLEGETNYKEEQSYEDDSEDSNDADVTSTLYDYSSYTFKSKVCLDLVCIDSKVINTDIFKSRVFRSVIDSLNLKLYNGRLLVHGTYATLFGNPYEYLCYIIKDKNDKPLFDKDNPTSLLREEEVYCPFFEDGQSLVGSRAPHTTMGNVLYAKNKELRQIKEYFNLSKNIVVVDAINNNIQQRLSGCDYDSDSMLLTDDKIIVSVAREQKDNFLVPYSDYQPLKKSKYDTNKNNLLSNLFKMDKSIAKNNVGRIINLSQLLNSHLWNQYKGKNRRSIDELYEKIALLSCLSGAEIDSSKRSFNFNTTTVFNDVKRYAKEKGYLNQKPMFFVNISNSKNRKLRINEITQSIKDERYLKTSMDYLWKAINEANYDKPRTDSISFFSLINQGYSTASFAGDAYRQADKAMNALKEASDIIFLKHSKSKKKKKKFEVEKKNFNIRLKACYRKIKNNINTIDKAKLVINQLEKENDGYSRLFLLLYIIDTFGDQLGYSLKSLFPNDTTPLTTLTRVDSYQKYKYRIFDRILLAPNVLGKLFDAIFR